MVTCAHGDTQTVEKGAHVEVVDVAHVERDDSIFDS